MVAAAGVRALLTVVLVVAVGAPMLLVLAPVAHACSCAVGSVGPDSLRASPIVFEGRAVGRAGETWAFDVDRVYRGPVTARQLVVTAEDSASCGAALSLGAPYLIDGRPDENDADTVRTGLCSMTRPTTAWTPSDRQQVVQRVGPGAPPPRPEASRPAEVGPDSVESGPTPAVVVAVAAAVVVAGLATAVALRRR